MSKKSKARSKRHKDKRRKEAPDLGYTPASHWWDAETEPRRRPAPLDDEQRARVLDAINRNLDLAALGLDVRRVPTSAALGFYSGDRRLGEIETMTAARIGRHRPMGDVGGDNRELWERVQGYLAEAVRDVAEQFDGPVDLIDADVVTSLPHGTPERHRALARSASQRIRLERTHGFEVPVRLTAESCEVTFWPVRNTARGLVAPFAVDFAGRTINGQLSLLRGGDVLPILVSLGVTDDDLRTAWLIALDGFAEITCPDTGKGATSDRSISSSLNPANEETRRLLDSHVVGHRRRLPPGQHHGAEVPQRAAVFGIDLAPGETWVRPHARGLPDDTTLKFMWKPSVAIDGDTREQRRAA